MVYDWTTFTRKIAIKASVNELYPFFSTKNGMERWFLRMCDYKSSDGVSLKNDAIAKKGDTYKFRWYGYSDETEENGVILQSNGRDVFEFTFNGNGSTDMIVNVALTTQGENTLVSLTQYNIPDTEHGRSHWHVGCMEGWTFYLANLKSIIEGGLDLRNKDENITGVINS
ncbi:MAG: SRPBCC domain-containing protein [Saprospiraceae bacterium]|nr:SRPBCC domain-containing protein [Saprospiraceae bacterium]